MKHKTCIPHQIIHPETLTTTKSSPSPLIPKNAKRINSHNLRRKLDSCIVQLNSMQVVDLIEARNSAIPSLYWWISGIISLRDKYALKFFSREVLI